MNDLRTNVHLYSSLPNNRGPLNKHGAEQILESD